MADIGLTGCEKARCEMSGTEKAERNAGSERSTMRVSAKAIILAVALVVCLSAVLNGTVAYLTDQTETQTSTFTVRYQQ